MCMYVCWCRVILAQLFNSISCYKVDLDVTEGYLCWGWGEGGDWGMWTIEIK